MSTPWALIAQSFDFDRLQQMAVVDGAVTRLLVACLLGGMVGVERELKRKAAGVRTNLLICMGSAFFTLMSMVLAGGANPDKSRVASNIVQGIGFLGAGLIIHNRSRVSGLTSAATIFVVASIGMACGAGLYAAAGAATVIVVVALEAIGFLERHANLKIYPLLYEARGQNQAGMLKTILDATDAAGERLTRVESDAIGELQRVSFALTATKKQHEHIYERLLGKPAIDALYTFRDPEED